MATTCNTFCISNSCKDKKKCACDCKRFMAFSPALEAACNGECNAGNYASMKMTTTDYLCKKFGGDVAFNQNGIVCPGYVPERDNVQVKAFAQQSQQELRMQELQSGNTKYIVALGAIVILALLGAYIWFK